MAERSLYTQTLDTYLQLEAESETKYEFHDGFILAMAGGTPAHGQIAANFISALLNALRAKGSPCKVYSSDVKVAIQRARRRCYPDISVVCGPVETDTTEPRAITNPVLIVEVLSEGTEVLDRGEKFRAYRQIESLREYVLVSQDKALVEVFSRTSGDTWRIQAAIGMEASFELPALDLEIANGELYFGVEEIE